MSNKGQRRSNYRTLVLERQGFKLIRAIFPQITALRRFSGGVLFLAPNLRKALPTLRQASFFGGAPGMGDLCRDAGIVQ
jgi:hypothetical protein